MKLSAPVFRLKRHARRLARREKIPLHAALDRVASQEGFGNWGHLSRNSAISNAEAGVLAALEQGDLVLLAARPGHGKTKFGLYLLAEAALSGFQASFFSSECSLVDVRRRLSERQADNLLDTGGIEIDLSDHLCADRIMERLSQARPGAVAVIDYLQVLDQRRTAPELSHQIEQLKRFALQSGIRLVFLSQVHRSFDPSSKHLPGFADLRLPNPVDLSLFSKGCFLHDGDMAVLMN